MRSLIVAFLASAAAFPASADLMVRNDANWLRLHEGPCTSEPVLAELKDEWREKFRAASAFVNGESFAACWIEQGGQVFILFSDGDRAVVPLAAFKKDEGL
jgi:hypothetical protein